MSKWDDFDFDSTDDHLYPQTTVAEDQAAGLDTLIAQNARGVPNKRRKLNPAQRRKYFDWTTKKYPWSSYGRQYIKAGTARTTDRYGSNYKAATSKQRAARKVDRYFGKGRYGSKMKIGSYYKGRGYYQGRGKFSWKKLGKVVKKGAKKAWSSKLGKAYRKKAVGAISMYNPMLGAGLRATGVGAYGAGAAVGGPVTNELVVGGHATEGIMRFDAETDQNSITLSHSEYINDLFGPKDHTQFESIIYDINVGLRKTFPQLSQIAANYQECEFIQLAFTYKTTQSDNATTGTNQVGSVLMATQYNPTLEKFVNKAGMLNSTGGSSSKSTESQYHGVECDAGKSHTDGVFLTRTKPVLAKQNVCDFDIGYLQVALAGFPASLENQTIGELHVSYTVKLSKPRAWTNQGLAIGKMIKYCNKNHGVTATRIGKTDGSSGQAAWEHLATPMAAPFSTASWAQDQAGNSSQMQFSLPFNGPGSSFEADLLTSQQGTMDFELGRTVVDYEFGTHEPITCSHIKLPPHLAGDVRITVECLNLGMLSRLEPASNLSGVTSASIRIGRRNWYTDPNTTSGVTGLQGTGIQSVYGNVELIRDCSLDADGFGLTSNKNSGLGATTVGVTLGPKHATQTLCEPLLGGEDTFDSRGYLLNFGPNWTSSGSASAAPNNACILRSTQDFRIRTATNGVDNKILVNIYAPFGAKTHDPPIVYHGAANDFVPYGCNSRSMLAFKITIEQINTSLNVSRTGIDDQVLMIDNLDQVVQYD